MLTVDLALAGIGIGAIAALAGLGLLVTYRATGVFNLAFGAIAMLAAYLMWEAVRVWHWPVGVAAVVDVFVFCPAFGLVLDRAVFRPLQRRNASPAESLVASVGVLVVVVGAAVATWGGQAHLDAPSIVPMRGVRLPGGATMRFDTLVELGAVAAIAVLAVVGRTRIGLMARAVIERRQLAELTAIDVDRVSAVSWIVGTMLAGLSGILLAPALRLDPYGLTLVVLETMAVVVIARLASPARAIAAALALGIAQGELTRFHPGGRLRPLVEALTSNLFVVALFVALLLLTRLDNPEDDAAVSPRRLAVRRDLPPPRGWWLPSLVLLVIPLTFTAVDLRTAQQIPGIAIILLSIVLLSGYSGQVSLGQAGFAGLGALFAARVAAGEFPGLPSMPGVLALLVAALLVVPAGLLAGWPAIRRRGLFLALITFAVGVVVSRLVFAQPEFVSDVRIGPPFLSERGFYVFELACLGVALLIVRNHHEGRLGRALLAVRDDEAGARASGIDVRRLRIVVFAVSAALAGLGGALLAQSARAFDATTFDPVQSIIWFAAVVVFGIDSAAGAVLAAALLVGIDAAFYPGLSTIVVGAGAVLLGRLPGPFLYSLRRVEARLAGNVGGVAPLPEVRLSSAGRRLAARLGR